MRLSKRQRDMAAKYCRALEADAEHSPANAAKAMGWDTAMLLWWRSKKEFRDMEFAVLEKHAAQPEDIPAFIADNVLKGVKETYLDALKENMGNGSKAREAAGLSKKDLDALKRDDPAFREREDATYEYLSDLFEEESARTALGVGAKTRDSGHLRWLMGKTMPDKYGEKPKIIDHRYSGKLTIARIDEEIEELLGNEELEQLESPDGSGEA